MGNFRWTEEEERILREHYLTSSTNDLKNLYGWEMCYAILELYLSRRNFSTS